MQTYTQLLKQFHQQQTLMDQEIQFKYNDILNELKRTKTQLRQKRSDYMFQSKRLKTSNKDFLKTFQVQSSLQSSRIEFLNDTMQEKRELVELQRQSLLQEIDMLNQDISKKKQQKNLLESQIKLLDSKEHEIEITLIQSTKNFQTILLEIKKQEENSSYQQKKYDKKISQLKEKLNLVHQQNLENSKIYKQCGSKRIQNKNKTFIGSILSWQNQKSQINKIPKKLFTKSQLQSILRSLYLIQKLSHLNYGNVIEHLINTSGQGKVNKQKAKNFYNNQSGQQIQISKLILFFEKDLLNPYQTKFLSKMKIMEFYQQKGLVVNMQFQGLSFVEQTNQLITRVVQHHSKLTSWFSRIENRNIQLSKTLKELQKSDDQLQSQINSIQLSATQIHINYLQERQKAINKNSEKNSELCKLIFQFNINVYNLVKRFQNLNKLFDKIIKSTNKKTWKRTFIQMEKDTQFLRNFTTILFKSPESIILDWNNAIKVFKSSISIDSTLDQTKKLERQAFLEMVMKNDLLRNHATPSMYDFKSSYLENIEKTFIHVFQQEQQIIENLTRILKDLLLFSKQGIEQYHHKNSRSTIPLNHKQQRQQRRFSAMLKISTSSKSFTNQKNPLLKLLNQSDSRLDRFFKKDQIKEQKNQGKQQKNSTMDVDIYDQKNKNENKFQENINFCIQSKEYFRRDNYKLIEKLERIDLKKKGQYKCLPFSVNTSLELQPLNATTGTIKIDKQDSRYSSTRKSYRKLEPRLSHQLLSTRHNDLSFRREKESSRKKNLRELLKNISNIASCNTLSHIRKSTIQNSKKISFPRKVILQKL